MPDIHDHYHYDENDIVNPETKHEDADVSVSGLMWFAVVFVAFAIFAHLLIYGVYRAFVHMENAAQNPPLTMVKHPAAVPVEPRLQPFPTKGSREILNTASPVQSTPVADMQSMRKEEDEYLGGYGWADRQKGLAHIPIDEAKKLALQHGFAVNPNAPKAVPQAQPADLAMAQVPASGAEAASAQLAPIAPVPAPTTSAAPAAAPSTMPAPPKPAPNASPVTPKTTT